MVEFGESGGGSHGAVHGPTRYIVFDTESVVDGDLLSRVAYPERELSADDAIAAWLEEKGDPNAFIPVTYHVPVAVAVARLDASFQLLDLACLDAPRFDSRRMVELFWKGVDHYRDAALVDFNGRGFDIPLLTLAAFRHGISSPTYFADPEKWGYRYRFTAKHIDLLEWITEYGGCRLAGGLNALAKMVGAPGKMGTSGGQVAELWAQGKIVEINDYCLHDVLDTYFVFLRTRVLTGEISPERERAIAGEARQLIEARCAAIPALREWLDTYDAAGRSETQPGEGVNATPPGV